MSGFKIPKPLKLNLVASHSLYAYQSRVKFMPACTSCTLSTSRSRGARGRCGGRRGSRSLRPVAAPAWNDTRFKPEFVRATSSVRVSIVKDPTNPP